uniref:Uncharacterized protein n=1 Tax=Amphimedon queenslandica TaxID=400682 RepID=A0A1X7TU92_AMPQE
MLESPVTSSSDDLGTLQRRNVPNQVRKLEVRKAAFQRQSLTDEKKKWDEAVVHLFVSSEESGEENCDRFMRPVLLVKKLPWRSDYVTRFFQQLDRKADKAKSKRGKQQTLQKVSSSISSEHPKPVTTFGP